MKARFKVRINWNHIHTAIPSSSCDSLATDLLQLYTREQLTFSPLCQLSASTNMSNIAS